MRQDLNSGNPFETDEFCVFLVRSVSLTPKGVVSVSRRTAADERSAGDTYRGRKH